MSIHRCNMRQSPNYEVKQRYIPTFVHEPIFQQEPIKVHPSRCTPTFHSIVFDTQGYNIKTIHEKNNKKQEIKAQKNEQNQLMNTYENMSQNVNLQKRTLPFNQSRDNWFDHTKQQILDSIKGCQTHRYSKERKMVDMSSDLVFTDYNYQKKKGAKKLVLTEKAIPSIAIAPERRQGQFDETQPQQKEEKIERENKKNVVIVQNRPQKKEQVQYSRQKQIAEPKIKENQKRQRVNKGHGSQKEQLKLKEKKANQRPLTAKREKFIEQKPTFTVVRKSRVQH